MGTTKMRFLWITILIGFLGHGSWAQEDRIIQPNNQGRAFIRDNNNDTWPAIVAYTTDGMGNVIPIGAGGSGGSMATQVNQGAPGNLAFAWPVKLTNGTTVTGVTADGRLLVETRGTLSIVADALPLPDGAATEATLFETLLTLGSIYARLPALGPGASTDAARVVLAADSLPLPVTGTLAINFPATLAVSAEFLPLPAGAATEARQVQQISQLGSIALSVLSVDQKLPTQGQKTSAGSVPVVLASDQSAIPTLGTHGVFQVGPWSTSLAGGTAGVYILNPMMAPGTLTVLQGSFPWYTVGTMAVSRVDGTVATSRTWNLSSIADSVTAVIGGQPIAVTTTGTQAVTVVGTPAITVSGTTGRSWTLSSLTDSIIAFGTLARSWVLSSSTDSVTAVLAPGGTVSAIPLGTQAISINQILYTLGTIGILPNSTIGIAGPVGIFGTTGRSWTTNASTDSMMVTGSVTTIPTGTTQVAGSVGRTWNLSSLTDSVLAFGTMARSWVLNSATDSVTIVPSGTQSVSFANSTFSRITSRNYLDTEESRIDAPLMVNSGTIFVGIAPDGTATSGTLWSVVRTVFDANGNPNRQQIRRNISWDGRVTAGW